jgi:hypothetical protein
VAPFRGAYLNQWAAIQPDGSARFGPLPACADGWNLTMTDYVFSRGFGATLLSLPVEVEPGKSVSTTVDLVSGQMVMGRVRGPKDEPLEYVWVSLTSRGERAELYGSVSDPSGNYMIRGVPAGDYNLEARRWAKRTGFG